MSRKGILFGLALTGAVFGTFVVESDAAACGGCFGPPPPPTETPTVVTDHRMILSISKDKSTLYDQIRYQGSPASFGWVLPIAGTVEVGLSANVVFQALDNQTQTQIVAPPLNCPARPSSCNQGFANASAPTAGGAEDSKGGVTVLKQEVVGPYETVQLASTDPNALENWLAQNGYVVADDVKPVIAAYVTEKFNFLALKLVPGKGVQDMRPVRVTTTGAGAVLPLRMVAAGTGPTVGITLWVVAEGRYEPQNFTSFYIKTDDLVWDWTAQKSNYVDLRTQKTTEGNGRAWETESSLGVYKANIQQTVQYGTYSGSGPYPQTDEERAQQDYLPVKDEQGNIITTAAQVRDADMAALFAGAPGDQARVTRLRADLAHAALDQDLSMTASSDQALLSNVRQLTRELNEPQCPVYNGCTQEGTAPRSEAIARSSSDGNESFACSTTPRSNPTWYAVGLGGLGIVLVNAMRRRRKG